MARQGRERRTERDDQRMDRTADQGNDDPSTAPESGEPEEAGRSRGQVLDDKGNVKRPAPTGAPQADESGRHQAMPE